MNTVQFLRVKGFFCNLIRGKNRPFFSRMFFSRKTKGHEDLLFLFGCGISIGLVRWERIFMFEARSDERDAQAGA